VKGGQRAKRDAGYLSGSQFLLDNKWFPHNTTVNILDVIRGSFKMTRCVVTLGDVAVVFRPVLIWNIQIRHTHKPTIRNGHGHGHGRGHGGGIGWEERDSGMGSTCRGWGPGDRDRV
jgi:hypothetical protein